jgi:hypothetical protein
MTRIVTHWLERIDKRRSRGHDPSMALIVAGRCKLSTDVRQLL